MKNPPKEWEPSDEPVRSLPFINNPWACSSFELNSAHNHLRINDQNLIQESIQRSL